MRTATRVAYEREGRGMTAPSVIRELPSVVMALEKPSLWFTIFIPTYYLTQAGILSERMISQLVFFTLLNLIFLTV